MTTVQYLSRGSTFFAGLRFSPFLAWFLGLKYIPLSHPYKTSISFEVFIEVPSNFTLHFFDKAGEMKSKRLSYIYIYSSTTHVWDRRISFSGLRITGLSHIMFQNSGILGCFYLPGMVRGRKSFCRCPRIQADF